ncbi:MAG TPA: DUF63 family protein [Candidatus Thermoplasmatota archaeon]|nr:DUF63 family protein [Candidatus Thermoplasmatota archaeon]
MSATPPGAPDGSLQNPPAARTARLQWGFLTPQRALALLAAYAALLTLGSLLAPDLVYYPFVWKYYYGPIVTDAAGMPLTRGGVTADAGYNLVSTVTWGLILLVGLWNVFDYFARRQFTMTRTLLYAFLPTIAAGGTLRGLIDADWIPEPWAYLFITPNIYVVIFAYTFAALVVGLQIESHATERGRFARVRHWHVVAAAGSLLLLTTFAGVAWYVFHPPSGFVRWVVLAEIFGYSALLTAPFLVAGWLLKVRAATDPLYALIFYGHIVDGMQNYLGITQGYTSKLMGTNFLAGVLGDIGLLVGKIVVFVPMLIYLKARVEPDPETPTNVLMLVLTVILALGLAMGFHGGVGLLFGV